MTQDEIELLAWAIAGQWVDPKYRDNAMREFEASIRRAYNAGLESGAAEAIRIWREAPNSRTNSALTSYRQNALGEGCTESAKAIRALKLPE